MKYLDNIRLCCIEPIIQSILKHTAGFSVNELPQKTTLVRMLTQGGKSHSA